MSFNVNDIAVKSAYFNGSEVKSIYYNGTEVWTSDTWPGWVNATWEDIYNLCKEIQNGDRAAWPADVVLGATKTTTLSTAVLGSTSVKMKIIGLDVDGTGVITFQSSNALANKVAFNSSSAFWSNSSIRNTYCANFYNYCDAKPYIKTLSKITHYYASNQDTKGTYNETVWLPSRYEILADTTKVETTTNANGNYDSTQMKAVKYAGDSGTSAVEYWMRSYYSINGNSQQTFNSSTGVRGNQKTAEAAAYFAPCFAIG